MASSETSVDALSDNFADMDLDQRTLLGLPPEIRLRLYFYLFHINRSIILTIHNDGRLHQAERDVMRDQAYNKVQLSPQVLRTCRHIWHEGTAYMLVNNRFEMLDNDTHNLGLANITPPTRALMQNINFMNRCSHRLNLTAIGEYFPSLQTINIHTQGPGAHLCMLAYELSRSLPCSSALRLWPTLELHINIPRSSEALETFTKELRGDRYWQLNSNVKDHITVASLFRNRSIFNLSDFEPHAQSIFSMGREMPRSPRIVLHGGLHEDHARALTKHESSYGDCAFEFLRTETIPASETNLKGYEKWIYIWKRKDEAIATALRGQDLGDTAALMRQWVPALSMEFVRAMSEAGL